MLAQRNPVVLSKALREQQDQGTAAMRILIADDHDLVRESIAVFLTMEGDIQVDMAESLPDAIAVTEEKGPHDLVLLDFNMPGMDGLTGLAAMIAASGGRPVALISGLASRDLAEQAIAAGAAGFVPKTLSAKSMLSAVRFMVAGEIYAPFHFMQQDDAARAGKSDLTKREADVLKGICEGKSNKEIARDLDVQEVTIKLHVKTLTRKLNARNRTHAAMIARDRGLG